MQLWVNPVLWPEDWTHDKPDWDYGLRTHNWHNHVGERIREVWHTFTPEQRHILALDAQERADNEEWD